MSHARAQIRAEATAILQAAVTLARTVASGRQYPVQAGELPAVLVYMREEVSTDGAVMGNAPTVERRAELLVAGVINVEDSDDLADALALQIEDAFGAAALEGGALQAIGADLEIEALTTTISASTETQRAIRVIELRYPVTYRTRLGAAGVILT